MRSLRRRARLEASTFPSASTPTPGRSPQRWRQYVGSFAGEVDEEGKVAKRAELYVLPFRDLIWAIWPPDPRVRAEREQARFRMHLVKHRSMLKQRIHSVLINWGKPCPVTDLFGVEGRRLLDVLQVPEPWRGSIDASLILIDDLEVQIAKISDELKLTGVEHPYTPLLMTAPLRRGTKLVVPTTVIGAAAHRVARKTPITFADRRIVLQRSS